MMVGVISKKITRNNYICTHVSVLELSSAVKCRPSIDLLMIMTKRTGMQSSVDESRI